MLASLAALLLLVQLFRSRRLKDVTTSQLVPPGGNNLVKLEARVLLSAIAGTLKPVIPASLSDIEAAPSAPSAPLTPAQVQHEAESSINTFRRDKPVSARRWEKVYWSVGVLGAATLLALNAFFAHRGISRLEWEAARPLVFPGVLLLLALTRDAPLAALVTLYLFPQALSFRSEWVSGSTSAGSWIIMITEIVYWAALISVPYYDSLDQLLAGAVSHGGANVANGLKNHIEEPTCTCCCG